MRIKTPPAVLQLHPIFARLDPEPQLESAVQDFACGPSTGGKKEEKEEKLWVASVGTTGTMQPLF